MIEFLKVIYNEIKSVHDEVYLEYNLRKEIKYPYITYSYSSERLNNSREGFYIDVDIWDKGNNTLRLEEITHELKSKLDGKQILTCDHLLQFEFRNSAVIPTDRKEIRRRWLEFYIKVDWRNE